MDFETYLISKKIDSIAFKAAEPDIWNTWSAEFFQVHPNSFTAQKLYLINPVRRKYPLKLPVVTKDPVAPSEVASDSVKQSAPGAQPDAGPAPVNPKPSVPRPVFKPKPKMN